MAKPTKTATVQHATGGPLTTSISGSATATGENTVASGSSAVEAVDHGKKTMLKATVELDAATSAGGALTDTSVTAANWDSVKVKTKTTTSEDGTASSSTTTIKAKGDGEADTTTIKTMTQEKTVTGEAAEAKGNAALLSVASVVEADDGFNFVTAETIAVEDALSSTTFIVETKVGTGAASGSPEWEANVALFAVDTQALGEDSYATMDLDVLTTDALASVAVEGSAFVS